MHPIHPNHNPSPSLIGLIPGHCGRVGIRAWLRVFFGFGSGSRLGYAVGVMVMHGLGSGSRLGSGWRGRGVDSAITIHRPRLRLRPRFRLRRRFRFRLQLKHMIR